LAASWTARQKKTADLKDKITSGHTTLASAKSIEEQWDHMRTNTLSASSTASEDQLYKAFQNWSTSSKVVLIGQKPQSKDSDDTNYSNYELHVDVTGSLDQIFSFLYSVESGPLGLKVDAIDLSTRDDRGQQLALGLTVSGLILNSTNSIK